MTAPDYLPFVERMIQRYEGGYGWDAGDSGGPTKFGITCYDLAEYEHLKMNSMTAWAPRVRAMSLSVADQIYASKYATQCCFDQLNAGCDCVVFDFGVNSGSSRAIRYAQTVVGAHCDGLLGPATLEAINSHDPRDFVNRLCDVRLRFMRGLRIWSRFGRGWSQRVADLRGYSLAIIPKPQLGAMHRPPPPEKPTRTGHSKELRIPKAFGKAYHPHDLKELKATHQE
jgi:lysozyme family protein